jgi:hypothetical protein
MTPRVLIILVVILVVIVAGMAMSLKRSAAALHRGDPNDAPPAHSAPAK